MIGLNTGMMNERTILEQLSLGDENAFKELFMHYHQKVFLFVLGLVKSEEGADDLTQEIFIKIWTKRDLMKDVNSLDAYLFMVSKYTVYSYLKKNKAFFEDIETVKENQNLQSENPHEELVAKDLSLLIDMIVESMPQQRKLIYTMSRKKGFTNQEISEKLNISRRTVENHLNLALKDIRKAILIFLIVITC